MPKLSDTEKYKKYEKEYLQSKKKAKAYYASASKFKIISPHYKYKSRGEKWSFGELRD